MDTKIHYYTLDGMKGISALTVLFFHIHYFLFLNFDFFNHGYLSVDIFFISSGYLFSLNYSGKLNTYSKQKHAIIKRITKLLPIFWMGMIPCSILYIYINSDVNIFRLLLITLNSFLIIPSLFTNTSFPINEPSWFIYTYLLTSILYFIFLHKIKNKILFIVIIASLLFYILLLYNGINRMMLTEYVRAILGFSIGMIIYRFRDKILHHLPIIPPLLLFCVWLALTAVPAHRDTPFFDIFSMIICAPLLILLLIRSEARAPKWCAFAGKLSYPLYASHFAVIMLLKHYMHRPNPWLAVAGVAAALVLAWVIAILNDRIQAWLRRVPTVPETPKPAE